MLLQPPEPESADLIRSRLHKGRNFRGYLALCWMTCLGMSIKVLAIERRAKADSLNFWPIALEAAVVVALLVELGLLWKAVARSRIVRGGDASGLGDGNPWRFIPPVASLPFLISGSPKVKRDAALVTTGSLILIIANFTPVAFSKAGTVLKLVWWTWAFARYLSAWQMAGVDDEAYELQGSRL